MNLLFRYISTYLSSFFSLPVRRASGVKLSHEEVINQLYNETVVYGVGLGVSNYFTDMLRVSIEVEVAHYETAIAWLKDLVYGAEFNQDRYISPTRKLSILLTFLILQSGCKSFWPRYSNLFHKGREMRGGY